MTVMNNHVILPWSIKKSVLMVFVFIVLIVSSIHGTTSSDSPNYMSNSCQVFNSNTPGSVFESNLNYTLFTQLLPKSSKVKFSNYTMGVDEDQVYALFYCKGDVDAQTCEACVAVATRRLKKVCDSWKEGIIWYEECTLRYANRTIFSIDAENPNYLPINDTGIVNDYLLDQYKDKFDSTMDELIKQAAFSKGFLPGFATKEVNLSSTGMIRGLAQCSPDIVGLGCYRCLQASLNLRDSWANTMVFLPSCLFQYDLYGTVAPPASPPPPRTFRALYIALIVLAAVFIVVAVFGGRWLWKRCSTDDNLTGRVCDEDRQSHEEQQNDDKVLRLPRYKFAQVAKMTKGFEKQIGEGGYGVVSHGRLLDGSREVAVKMLNETDAPKQFSNEINVFSRISHKNLVSLLGYCEDETKLALIYEYMDKGDLRSLLSDNAGSLSWTDRLKIAVDVAEGLHYLHESGEVRIVHRDVKPANILLNQNLQAKVADFGLCKIFPEKDITTLNTQVVITPGYTAPEYYNTGMLNEKVDVYSFGVVLLELITGKPANFESSLITWFLNRFNEGDIGNILDSNMTRSDEQTKQIVDESSVWMAAELANECIDADRTKRPIMWNIIVRLKECLVMEVRKNARTCSTGSTTIEMMNPIIYENIVMEPEAA